MSFVLSHVVISHADGCMQDASAMYLEAVELMEDDGKESMALDIFRQAIGQLLSFSNFPPTLHLPFFALCQFFPSPSLSL